MRDMRVFKRQNTTKYDKIDKGKPPKKTLNTPFRAVIIKLINYCKQIVFDLPKVRPRCTRYNGVLLEQEANNMKLFLS